MSGFGWGGGLKGRAWVRLHGGREIGGDCGREVD